MIVSVDVLKLHKSFGDVFGVRYQEIDRSNNWGSIYWASMRTVGYL